jgi:uncharacterized protein
MTERRISGMDSLKVERRAEGEAPRIVGHASVFNEWTTLYEGRYWVYREIVRPGAFRNAIAEKQDVRGLFNHDSNFVLGRTKSGTLELEEDGSGLVARITPPDTQTIRDLVLAPIERGDVTGMSFAFIVRRGDKPVVRTELADGSTVVASAGERITIRYEGDTRLEDRELIDLDLYDVSPVTYPAYDGTDVAMRSRFCPGLEQRIRELDRPHTAAAPRREEIKRWLESQGK